MKQVFALFLTIITMNSIIFSLIPNSVYLLAFSGQTFFSGEIWRLITFPFTHINLTHLSGNIVALSLVAILASEVELKGKDFLCCFMLSGILIALPEGLLFPSLLIAGSSLGIYAVLGSLSIKGSNFVSKYILVPILGASVFSKYIFDMIISPEYITNQSFIQSTFHFFGFLSGISIFYFLIGLRKKRRKNILRR